MDVMEAAALAKHFNVKVYTIGIGQQNSGMLGMLTNLINKPTSSLAQAAEETGGNHFEARTTQALRQVYREIDKLEPTTAEYLEYKRTEEKFAPWLYVALILLMIRTVIQTLWTRKLM